jgi:hypothetical protein
VHRLLLLALLPVPQACGESPVTPSPLPLALPPPPVVQAPPDGTLEVTLEWDPNYVGTLLLLRLENQSFPPTSAGWSPVVGRLAVQAGGRYLIAVALAGADWLPEDPFVLTTSLVP